MEELIYFCVRIVCIGYLLYSVYGWRRRIETVCTLLYGKPCVKKEKKETVVTESAVSDTEVMGSTRYVLSGRECRKDCRSLHEPAT